MGRPTIVTVLSEGKVQFKPEIVELTVGITNLSTASAQASVANDVKVKNLKETAKKFGIANSDIKIDSPSIVPVSQAGSKSVYQGVSSAKIKVKDLGSYEKLVTQLRNQNFQNITTQFSTKDPDDLEKKISQALIADGKVKAQKLSKSLGKFFVGSIASINQITTTNSSVLSPQQTVEIVRNASVGFEVR